MKALVATIFAAGVSLTTLSSAHAITAAPLAFAASGRYTVSEGLDTLEAIPSFNIPLSAVCKALGTEPAYKSISFCAFS